jgi:signal transduction histidine kinase
MSSDFSLNWATLAVSIFNTILLLWLGLTVILNSEQRSLGVWIAGAGLLLGSLFFLSHTVILGIGPLQPDVRMDLWWRTGWIPVVSMPYAWYLVMLWYSSYWDDPHSAVHQRHQIPIILATLLAISTVGLILLFNALPSYNQLIRLDLGGVLSIGGIPVLMVVYPFYLIMCIGFSLDVLLHPGTPVRLMGQLARQRARPWLLVATSSLLLVSLLVGGIIVWGLYNVNQIINPSAFALIISSFDLVIDLLIAVTIVSVGQAIVSYEIFTGKILPRQGLKRYWKWAIVLSIGFGIVVSLALLIHLEQIFILILSIVMITGIYAILGWSSFSEQEHYLKSLHPFITSQHLYDQLIIQNPDAYTLEITGAFHALCADILGVRQGFLVPMGIFGPLVGSPISYPEDLGEDEAEALQLEVQRSINNNIGFTPLLLAESGYFGRNALAISLWSERGLIGALILGEKLNSSLFTQEEIEIARTFGERLIDSKASNVLAHRLMELERQRLSETRVLDQQTRRILHDDILPRIHSIMIKLSAGSQNTDSAVQEMGEIHHQLTDLMHELPVVIQPEITNLGLVEALQKSIENEYRPYFNTLTWQVDDRVSENAAAFTPYVSNVIYHAAREAVRNAAHHGRQSDSDFPINLSIAIAWQDRLMITIQDDGIGFDTSSKNADIRSHGLALHSTLMAVVGGSLAIESIAGKKTKVILKLPA